MKCQDCIRRGRLVKADAAWIRSTGNKPECYCEFVDDFVPRKAGERCDGYKAKPKREADNGE